jgi:hypothetical protein
VHDLARSTRFLGRIWISYVFGRLSRVFLSIVVSLMYRLPSSRRMRSTRLVIIDSQLLQHHHSLGDPTSTHILRSQYQTPHICIITIASARMHAALLAVGKHFVVSDGRTVWYRCQQLANKCSINNAPKGRRAQNYARCRVCQPVIDQTQRAFNQRLQSYFLDICSCCLFQIFQRTR